MLSNYYASVLKFYSAKLVPLVHSIPINAYLSACIIVCARIDGGIAYVDSPTCKTSQRSIRQEPLTKRQLCQRCVHGGDNRGGEERYQCSLHRAQRLKWMQLPSLEN